VVAHELVHAMANTSIPRFFDDPHHDHEERTAVSIGRLARTLGAEAIRTPKVPLLPMGGATGSASALPSGMVHQAAAATPTGSAGSGTAPAGGAAASGMRSQIRRSTGGRSTTTVRKSTSTRAAASGAPDISIQRSAEAGGAPMDDSTKPTKKATGGAPNSAGDPQQTATERLDQIDELAALIEARVLAELERRGGQHRGWI
jgi:hypothetical protein